MNSYIDIFVFDNYPIQRHRERQRGDLLHFLQTQFVVMNKIQDK